jgi:hypothetical protein
MSSAQAPVWLSGRRISRKLPDARKDFPQLVLPERENLQQVATNQQKMDWQSTVRGIFHLGFPK